MLETEGAKIDRVRCRPGDLSLQGPVTHGAHGISTFYGPDFGSPELNSAHTA